jgi:chromosome segregation protein
VAVRTQAEDELAAEEKAVAAAVRAAADRREGLARLAGQVSAARTRVDTRSHEIERLETSLVEARERAEHAHRAFTALETQVAGLDDDEVDLDAEHASAAEAFRAAETQVEALRTEEQTADRERAALAARLEALEIGLARKDGSGALLAAGERLSGLLGSVAELITVRSGYESAVAAALGAAADAVAVHSVDDAVQALAMLKADDAGRAGVVFGVGAPVGTAPVQVPPGAVAAAELVQVRGPIEPSLRHLLAGVVVVDDLDAARSALAAKPALTVVTRDGDVLGGGLARGGSSAAPSLVEVQAAVDECRSGLEEARHRAERAAFALAGALEERRTAQERVEAALTRLHESDARMAAVAEQLGQLGSQARSASEEAERLAGALAASVELRAADLEQLAELEQRLSAAGEAGDESEPDTGQRDALDARCVQARAAEMEARLAVRTGEERVAALAGRAEQLRRAAAAERAARERAAELRERRAREAAVATAVVHGAQAALARLESSLSVAAEARATVEREREARDNELHELRRRTRELAVEIEKLTDVVHRDEVARAEQRLRIEQVENRAIEEYGVDAAALLAEYGPDQLVPPTIEPDAEPVLDSDGNVVEPQPYPFVRSEQEKRLKAAERGLSLLGRINPLALEEYAALEERLKFLTEQLEDLKNTKRDLLDIVREVDERVEQVFTEAYLDVEREFKDVFSRLFPGGEGRLVLTDPANMLTTGVEVEARPPGKKVKRLSLLSGGERSLTAVAFLVALFKARPSPFYVMDEVEAALDDVNLQRLIGVMEELRASSQLIIITHQKRTMEIADALYGVSMRGDGVTTVISQRLRETEEGVDGVVDVTEPVPAGV